MMDLVKKNLFSLVCGVVALIAVGAIFWPISGYFDELRGRVVERARVYDELKRLDPKPRSWPNVSLDQATQPPSLDMFPTSRIIEQGKALVDRVKAESGTMYKTAWEMNRHAPLTEGALPNGSASPLSRFVTEYKEAVDVTRPEYRMNSRLVKLMKGGFLPHNDQITAEKNRVRAEINRRGIPGPGGVIVNQPDLDAEFALREGSIPGILRSEAAQNSMVYCTEASFDRYGEIANLPPGSGTPEVAKVWVAQVNLWVQEDVCRAIATANEGFKNVIEAPVKRLDRISVVGAPAAFKSVAVGTIVPTSELPKPEVEPQLNFLSSISGRAQCPLYDVVPFNMVMLVDATQVQRVLQALGRNRFITVTECSIELQDVSMLEAQGYLLGSNPLVLLNMNAEALLLREWTIPLMPAAIRRGLGLPETDTPPQ